MKNIMLNALVASLFGIASVAGAQEAPDRTVYADLSPGDPILNDLYVELYLARWDRAGAEIERQEAVVVEALAHRNRMERLLVRNAVSRAEYELSIRDSDIASLKLQDLQSAAEEARLLLDISVDRVSLGLAMPICADVRF